MVKILEAKNTSKSFGGLKAVNDVTMEVHKGEIFGIIGPNGAGKTTFFNLCSGTYEVSSGQIFLNGENITNLGPEKIARKGLARTFQNIKLFNYMSVLDNVKIGCHIHTSTTVIDAIFHTKNYKKDELYATEHAIKILKEVGLEEYALLKAGNLAYGTQRKVEIARALATNPSILLLDEPAAGMNPNETWSLLEFIKKIRDAGRTVVVIEHDMKFVMNLCDRILVLSFGQKICEGTPEHVKNDAEVQRAYFGKSGIVEDHPADRKTEGVTHVEN